MPAAIGVALATPCTALDVQVSRPASGIISNNRSARTKLKVLFSQSPCNIGCARLAAEDMTRWVIPRRLSSERRYPFFGPVF